MKNKLRIAGLSLVFAMVLSCGQDQQTESTPAETPIAGQSAVADNDSQKDVVKVAVGSADHTTLVKAVQTAELVDALSNAGPFTVFAPVNAAFDALPAGTVEDLLKPENKGKLQDILSHHVYVGSLKPEQLTDGMTLNMVDGNNVTVHHKDGKVLINEAEVIASVPASNGIVHVVNKVILP
ncbi:fasciclin domain-containing protein [Bacteroidota bacterium]